MNSFTRIQNSKNNSSGSGYTQTVALWEKSSYEAFKAVKDYNDNQTTANHPNNTGWFLPTVGQYYAVMIGLGGGNFTYEGLYLSGSDQRYFKKNNSYANITDPINEKLSKVGDENYTEFFGSIEASGWTSSESSTTGGVRAHSGVLAGYGAGSFRLSTPGKSFQLSVRPFLAF